MRRILTLGSMAASALMLMGCNQDQATTAPAPAEIAGTQPAPESHPGEAPYLERCAQCHDQVVYKAPSRQFLGMMAPDAILAAMNGGIMATQADGLNADQRRAVSEFLTGRSLDDAAVAHPPPRCEQSEFDLGRAPAALGWGIDRSNSRFQPAAVAGVIADEMRSLSVKWAFAYPNATRARSQPAVAGGALFVGSHDGTVYSLDAETGCLRWSFRASAEVRTGIIVSDWDDDETAAPSVYFGDILARAYSLDARTGELNWMSKVDDHPNATITGTPALVGDRLFVPVSSLEVTLAANPQYPCCTFRGSLVSLDAASGEAVWKSYTIDDEPAEVAKTRVGTSIFAPSGAPIWSSPTVDEKRGRLYAGTGENYSSPAGGTSDAIIAFDLSSGEKIWVSQQTEGDAWNVGCLSDYTTDDANCPEENGPDYDFAASPILVSLDDGHEILVAGQKSGVVAGIDPDSGETLWRTQVGRGGVQGGVHFGMAAEGATIYVPISDQAYPEDLTRYKYTSPPRPGMYALDAADGRILWSTPADDVCGDREYCDPGISQAVTAVPGAVIAGHMDGRLRIYSATDGAVIWEMNTLREFQTVSGERARGGSFGGGGPMVAHGMIYVNSGYGMYFHMPGNVLLALAPDEA